MEGGGEGGAECLVQFSAKLSNRQCFQRYNTIRNKQTKQNKKTETLYLALEGILSRKCFKLVAAPHVIFVFFFS